MPNIPDILKSRYLYLAVAILCAALYVQSCTKNKSLQNIIDDQTSQLDAAIEMSLQDDARLKQAIDAKNNYKERYQFCERELRKTVGNVKTTVIRDTVFQSKLVAMECPNTPEEAKIIIAELEKQLTERTSALRIKARQAEELIKLIEQKDEEIAELSTIETITYQKDYPLLNVSAKSEYSFQGKVLSQPLFEISQLESIPTVVKKSRNNFLGFGYQTILNNQNTSTTFTNLYTASYARRVNRFMFVGDVGGDKEMNNISFEGKLMFNF